MKFSRADANTHYTLLSVASFFFACDDIFYLAESFSQIGIHGKRFAHAYMVIYDIIVNLKFRNSAFRLFIRVHQLAN